MPRIKTGQTAYTMQQFTNGLRGLNGEELLDRMLKLQSLPPASKGGSDLRSQQRLVLESALQNWYGIGEWKKALEDRKNAATPTDPETTSD